VVMVAFAASAIAVGNASAVIVVNTDLAIAVDVAPKSVGDDPPQLATTRDRNSRITVAFFMVDLLCKTRSGTGLFPELYYDNLFCLKFDL